MPECHHTRQEVVQTLHLVERHLRGRQSGLGKHAYRLPCGNHIIKWGRYGDDDDQLHKEIDIWRRHPSLRTLLAPIEMYSRRHGGWILQRYVRPIKRGTSALQQLFEGLLDAGVDFDNMAHNIGWLDEKPVLYDWGEENVYRLQVVMKRYATAA